MDDAIFEKIRALQAEFERRMEGLRKELEAQIERQRLDARDNDKRTEARMFEHTKELALNSGKLSSTEDRLKTVEGRLDTLLFQLTKRGLDGGGPSPEAK